MKTRILILSLVLFSCQILLAQGWQPVLRINEKGEVIAGSKDQLIQNIRQGKNVKIAWGWKRDNKSIEHISEPTWIAIMNEQDVLFHLDPQVFGGIEWEDRAGTFENKNLKEEWRVIIDTNGTFDAVWYDRDNHEVTKRMPQRHRITWFVQNANDETPKPFFAGN